MYIIGLGGSLHDYACCLMKDADILVAIEEERITRQKHAVDIFKLQDAILNKQVWKFLNQIPKDTLEKSLEYCLNYADITIDDVDFFVTTDSNLHLDVVKKLNNKIVINHHLAHMASAFYPSEFQEAAILVIDGKGSEVNVDGKTGEETITLGYGSRNNMKTIAKTINHSIGHFYEAVTLGIGFHLLEAGKTMGLSSYGKETYLKEMRNWYDLLESGEIQIHLREDEMTSFARETISKASEVDQFQVKADLAASAQLALEEMIIHITSHLYNETKSKNICIAGGVGLNSVANGKILALTNFEKIFVQPAAGDNGLAIGTAMYGAHYLRQLPRNLG